MKKNTIGILVLGALLLPGIILSHDMWVESGSFFLKPGSYAVMQFPSDHTFPASNNEFVPDDKVVPAYILTPGGGKVQIVKAGENSYRTAKKLDAPGTCLAVTGKKWMFWTQTTTGWEEGKSKKDVPNAVKGTKSGKFCKAIYHVGRAGGSVYQRIVGHDLEIIPLKDPGTLKVKDTMPVKVLFKGKPYSGDVKGTYEGFSSEKDTYAFVTGSGKDGMAGIRILKPGKWIINVGHREDVKGSPTHDDVLYSATLAFEIR